MTFEELWKTLPLPANYHGMDDADKRQWKIVVEHSFCRGLFDGAHKSASAKTADSKRIADLEAAVAEIRAAMATTNRFGPIDIRPVMEIESKPDITWIVSRTKSMESALKVIHTWASFPESFDLEQTKRLCMSALGREE
jgi:hypothetical protein